MLCNKNEISVKAAGSQSTPPPDHRYLKNECGPGVLLFRTTEFMWGISRGVPLSQSLRLHSACAESVGSSFPAPWALHPVTWSLLLLCCLFSPPLSCPCLQPKPPVPLPRAMATASPLVFGKLLWALRTSEVKPVMPGKVLAARIGPRAHLTDQNTKQKRRSERLIGLSWIWAFPSLTISVSS